jgi:hypothetical protein
MAWPIEPLHGRQDALLDHLRALAAEVNAYKERTGSLPQSLKDSSLVTSGCQLVVRPDSGDFLIVANHVFKDATGAEFYYAVDGNLQVQKVPVAEDPQNDSAAADQPGS